MTLRSQIRAIGMREARAHWRSVVAEVIDGQPILVLRDQQPSAVMLRFDEVQRWRRVEETLSALHGLEIYPELALSTTQLASLVRGEERPSATTLRGLARQSRDILGALRTTAVSDVPREFASLLDEIESGRLMTIVVRKELAVTVVSPREYDRLLGLNLALKWFRTAGLDLETAEPDACRPERGMRWHQPTRRPTHPAIRAPIRAPRPPRRLTKGPIRAWIGPMKAKLVPHTGCAG